MDIENIERALQMNNISNLPSLVSEYFHWSFELLIEHILVRHHRFSKVAIERICSQLIEKLDTPAQGIANERLRQYPILSVSREWLHCMEYMNDEVFVYILALSQANKMM